MDLARMLEKTGAATIVDAGNGNKSETTESLVALQTKHHNTF